MGRPAPENLEAHAYTPTVHARTVAAYAKAVCYGTLFHPFLQEAAMVKKLQKLSNDKKKSSSVLASTVKDSAQQIWLAGLGAFAKAQALSQFLVSKGLTRSRPYQWNTRDGLLWAVAVYFDGLAEKSLVRGRLLALQDVPDAAFQALRTERSGGQFRFNEAGVTIELR